ncbi:helix-turn-helix domain-containing protein [Virgibacillus doumboii]|uniref:helix-turn-helix domain-containing protein n=1 Tax=Virgibacillus doumboii TaxID=2697503 RepID=UPI0013DF83D6|nr:helix-turn-helix domain-containing protein [Virgibacillus doumboii]
MENHQFLDIQKAEKLLEINKMLTKSLKLEEVLQNVIEAAKELIEISDTIIIIYLYDEATEKLHFAEGEGIDKESLGRIAFSPGESIAGKVFVERNSKLFTSEKEIDSYMQNMREENYKHYYKGVYNRKIKSAFCVPIMNKDNCLGVLVVDNFEKDNVFTETDMKIIEVVADQSAIAIDNSNVYRRLKEKNDLLSQSTQIHNQFYNLIIRGEGIDTVLNLLESIIDSKVTYQSTVFYDEKDSVYPIVRGDEVLGVLELEKAFNSFSRMQQIAIEHASLTIALELVKDNALFEKELRFREEVFNQLLEGLSYDDLKRALHYIDWDENWKLQCIIMEDVQEPLWNQKKLTDKERLVRSMEQSATSIAGNSFIVTRAYQLILIVPKIKEGTIDKLIKTIELQWGKNKQFVYGIGRETEINELAISYKEAIRSIGYAKSNPKTKIVEYAKMGIERLLHEVDPSTIEIYMYDKLRNLFTLGSDFVATLQCYIRQNKNHKETADALHIHPNTLYYRLKKIEEALDIDLNKEKEWIDLVIAMDLYMASNKNEL